MGFLFVLVFILGIIFVLLPFLETTPPPSAVPAPQARPRPQIFTSNPLTTLVKRIVNALQTEWDKKREKRRLAVARMQEKRKLAPTNYRAALLKTLPSQEEAPGEPIELPQGEDDGNWLIAPQISPEDMGVKGMHEVNTDEELPHSAEMQATEQPLQALPLVSPTEEDASFSAQKEPLLLARANTNLQLPKPARYAPEPTKTQAPLSETEKALKELMDVVYPERRLAKLVEDYASVKFGLIPATPASLKEKEAFIKEKKEQVIKEFRRLQWEDIMRMLDSQEPPPPPAKDYLGNYVRAAKREGKETIDLPITIVSKEEEGKVRLTKMGPTDAAKIKEAMEAVGKVFNPNSDGNERLSSTSSNVVAEIQEAVNRLNSPQETVKDVVGAGIGAGIENGVNLLWREQGGSSSVQIPGEMQGTGNSDEQPATVDSNIYSPLGDAGGAIVLGRDGRLYPWDQQPILQQAKEMMEKENLHISVEDIRTIYFPRNQ